jgi:hydroxymethylbilane synthase
MRIRLGTRGSRLALIQSELVALMLRDLGHEVELVPIVTEGDVRPVDMSPGEGVFVAAIAQSLLEGEIDVAVHSAKDVPLVEAPALVIAAYPERADPRDALITRRGRASLATLEKAATVGTDSPRRTGFVLAARPDLVVVPMHGNVDTRLQRLDDGAVDALVIAAAGVDRLGRGERIDERLDAELVAPAPGQGALAVQARRSDVDLLRILREMDGTCRAPIGALAAVTADGFTLLAAGVSSDGTEKRVERVEGAREDAIRLATEAGRLLIEVAFS